MRTISELGVLAALALTSTTGCHPCECGGIARMTLRDGKIGGQTLMRLVLLLLFLSSCGGRDEPGFRDVPPAIGFDAEASLSRNGVIYLRLFGPLDSDQLLVIVDGLNAPVETKYCKETCDPTNNDACVSQRCVIMARPAALLPPSASVSARSIDGAVSSFAEIEVLDTIDIEAPVVALPVFRQNSDGLVSVELDPMSIQPSRSC
jgi:hypothetical protein